MAQNSRGPRPAEEARRLAEALRINLLKRKSLAKLKKADQKEPEKRQE